MESTGPMKPESNPWKAISMPAVNSPAIMRLVPKTSTTTFARLDMNWGMAPK